MRPSPLTLQVNGQAHALGHTWTQDLHLHLHIHVHALMACGGLDAQGHWRSPKRSPSFLFPVHALSKVFRGKFLDALQLASTSGALAHDPANPPRGGSVQQGLSGAASIGAFDQLWCSAR